MTYITKQRIGFFILVSFIAIVFFIIPYFDRKDEALDIKAHSKFAIGRIFKLSTSLKSGDAWHYQFKYDSKIFEDYKSTHVDYDVKIGDYFLVNFSSKNPDHNMVLYDYKLNDDKLNCIDSIWDTIPLSILHSGLKR